MTGLELWGGPECTLNRVGGRFRDQFAESGHDVRIDDLDLFAGLGISALRYPVGWERVSPDRPDVRDWSWTDARLRRLRELGVRVIAGLVHHGGGPRYTDLLAGDFATGLAAHARAAAERYPWIEEWTPVNEPVTTARFAALYGHWYPHRRDEGAFWLALLNQVDGVRLSMREIRRSNAGARLIQTDDLGRTYATSALRDQAAFDNARRWMGWDLLCGRVTRDHMMWQRLCRLGLGDRLRAIADDPCVPDVIGVNHYLTSDRFLDHRVQRYPPAATGGNGRRSFADVEGVRALRPPPAGLAGVLQEAWARYRLPLAVTEVHNGCTREEQMRWMADAWHTAGTLRDGGVDVRAVTSWALLGSHGWNTLLTADGIYEPGAFDVRAGGPRPTALAGMLGTLASGTSAARHPVLQGEGWWSRDVRLHHPGVPRPAPMREHAAARATDHASAVRPILITGGTGTLGGALAAACRHRDIAHVLTTRAQLDLMQPAGIAAALDAHRPWVVIDASGWVRVDEAESDPDACFAANHTGAALLARLCAERGIATVSFSSDLVFDGSAVHPYTEADRPAPLNVYGRSKAAMERSVAELAGTHLVVRTAAFFSPFDPHNFAVNVARGLAAGQAQRIPDETVCPTYVPDLCDAVLDLAVDGERGLWHLTNGEAVTWVAFARRLAECCGLDTGLIQPVAPALLRRPAERPVRVALATGRGQLLPSLSGAIDRFASEMRDAVRMRAG